MGLKAWLRDLLGESRPKPPEILSEREVIERVREYAATRGYESDQPTVISLERHAVDPANEEAGRRWVYIVAVGENRPVPFADVDAKDGSLIAWRSLPR
jgi:hypothetical protein